MGVGYIYLRKDIFVREERSLLQILVGIFRKKVLKIIELLLVFFFLLSALLGSTPPRSMILGLGGGFGCVWD